MEVRKKYHCDAKNRLTLCLNDISGRRIRFTAFFGLVCLRPGADGHLRRIPPGRSSSSRVRQPFPLQE